MELLTNLTEQLTIITILTTLTKQEREALVGRDFPLFQTCRQQKDSLQKNITQLEQQRSTLCNNMTLREVAAEPGAPADKLLDLRRTLKAALRELKSEHDTNIIFYKQEMAYLNQIREVINREASTPRYTKNGALAQNQETTTLTIRA